jgi:large subunit ribosomal protein L20
MVRVAKAVASRKRRKRLLKQAKGFVGDRKNHIRLSKDGVIKALAFNYHHRKQKKRSFRQLWTIRINVAARVNGMSYSKFMHGLKKADCKLNRKILAYLAIKDPNAFNSIALVAKKGLVA